MGFFPANESGTSKRPCKYGPRDDAGYCPKKPAGARSTSKRPCKYGPRDAAGYCPKKPSSNSFAASVTRTIARNTPQKRAERAIVSAVGRAGGNVAVSLTEAAFDKKTRDAVKAIAGIPVSALAAMTKGARAGIVGAILTAGALSYFATKYIIDKRASKKEQLQQTAANYAKAYRDARAAAADLKGAPLSAAELATHAATYKAALKSLGLSTSDLSKLR